ncbi:Major facilitator superfamily [Seminavis robusta]|uniref:Major facilitator superfamily n=1 Tax=Seminavis robusta TaxID=568900 RepID=A0A9N8DKW5_9STRA|nr:Major facilitator superfamily [Seminavis robusta]|eukprot:Sro200_g084820.1 Major facilitator superfamily (563) ;mRNA; r:63040-64728
MASVYDLSCCTSLPLEWMYDKDDDGDLTVPHKELDKPDSSSTLTPEAAVEARRREKEENEALGWTLDAAARGVAIMGTAVFVSSELLRLAKNAAGCGGEDANESGERCENRVYGMKPTSLLTNIMTIVGLISAFLMPLMGSVIDHTSYRRQVGRVSAALMTIFILLQMLLLPNHWFLASIMQVLVAFSYLVHLTVVYAYLPELTTSAERLSNYTAKFTAAQYSSSVLFLVLMVIILSAAPNNLLERYASVDFSQSVIVCICAVFMGYAWTFLFRKRPASQHVPEGSTPLTAGFYKIFQTSQTIMLHHSAIKWFLISVVFTEAATYTFSTIAITYMTDQLNFTSRENGICILILLLFGVPGTRLAAWTNRINPIRSLQACLLLWIATTTLAAIFLKDPGQQHYAYVFAIFWGLCLGWIHPTEKTLYCTIIPRGQEAELMGTYICAGQILSWMPSLVFSVMNEADISMRIGLFSLTFYCIASFFILFLVGDYEEAVSHARDFDHTKPSKDDSSSDDDPYEGHRRQRQPEADFVIISDYEEAVAHMRSLSIADDSEASSAYVPQC